jgi:NTE family protein
VSPLADRGIPGRPRVAVALGGGGARGYAHIGILEVLRERGFDVVSVAGSSMGALTGGLFAAGGLDAYADWVRGLSHRDVLRLYDISPRAPGAIRAERIFARVADILGNVRIEELPIAFTAVATDLTTGEEHWFRDGPVDVAIRASAALPGFMTPVVVDGRLLADGGLTNPLPMAPAVAAGADLTVAVVVSGRRRSPAAPSSHRGLPRRTARHRIGTAELSGSLPPGLGLLDVMDMSLEAVRTAVLRSTLAACPPDVLVTVPHTVALPHGHRLVLEGVEVDRQAERRADLVLPSVAAPDGPGVVEVDVPALPQGRREVAGLG